VPTVRSKALQCLIRFDVYSIETRSLRVGGGGTEVPDYKRGTEVPYYKRGTEVLYYKRGTEVPDYKRGH